MDNMYWLQLACLRCVVACASDENPEYATDDPEKIELDNVVIAMQKRRDGRTGSKQP